jgi:2-keto-4-pentenoate hydratase/2-oxohepta-3-ene-1,7-dioic acid hydratase in catechol pathway
MKIARVLLNGEIFYSSVESNIIKKIKGDIFGKFEVTEECFPLFGVKVLAPVTPPNIVAIGLNYGKHANESNMKTTDKPLIFLKATSSLAADGDAIVLPKIAPNEVDYEGELVVVISKTAKDVEEKDALDYVLGYTCGNDVSARDCQLKLDTQWARGKSFDTFCPIGPFIVTDIDPNNAPISTRLNGAVVQDSNTRDMIFSAAQLVSYCSKNMTLLPGTIIMTGTPEGVGFARKIPLFMKNGDKVEVSIGGVGTLRNHVAAS